MTFVIKRAILAHFYHCITKRISNVLLCYTSEYVMYILLDGRGQKGIEGYLE